MLCIYSTNTVLIHPKHIFILFTHVNDIIYGQKFSIIKMMELKTDHFLHVQECKHREKLPTLKMHKFSDLFR